MKGVPETDLRTYGELLYDKVGLQIRTGVLFQEIGPGQLVINTEKVKLDLLIAPYTNF